MDEHIVFVVPEAFGTVVLVGVVFVVVYMVVAAIELVVVAQMVVVRAPSCWCGSRGSSENSTSR